ncbi:MULTISPECIES: hypothetical protein [Butyricimonas]|uniref:hypothetical protein n=1 Tax=Butyricimonas TaxID=574697 RepID=UPI0007FB2597|nr:MULTISPECIES: hypothetical protein [Butyricimonas]
MATEDNLRDRAKEIRGAFLPESVTNEAVGGLLLDIINFILSYGGGGGEGGKPDARYWNKDELNTLDQYLYVLGDKIKALYADDAGDSELFDGHNWSDYFDQPLRTFDDVKFKSLQSTEFESKVKGWIIDALGNAEFRDILGRVITITGGLMTDDFIAGMTGAGTGIVNKSEVHTDRGVFRKYIEVLALVVSKMYWRGGRQCLSPAGMKVSKVEEYADYWRLYMETEDGQTNDFTVGAQARCNNYGNGTQKYYWRLVTGIGENYADLSKTDCDTGSGVPAVGDDVVQFGHRTDPYLQWVVMDSSFPDDAGRTIYAGVNSYDLSDKMVLRIGVDPKDQTRIGLFTRHGEFSDVINGINKGIKDNQQAIQDAKDATDAIQSVVDNLTGIIIPDMQNQLDGAIQSWDGEVEPTLNNYPANEWFDEETGRDERAKHVGDTYIYYTTDSEGNTVSSRYNFRFVDGVYKWEKIADSVSAELEVKLRELTGTVGKKNSITYSNNVPKPAYYVDDLWIKEDGSMYICRAKKMDGMQGDAADWELFNDTMLRLAKMSDDGVISKEEKATLRDTWNQIQKEFTSYQAQATTYGVSITALQNAYNTLSTFLTNTVKLSQNIDTSLTVAQKTEYNQDFANYYSERTAFANVIAQKVAEESVDNLQIGSVNLISRKMMLAWNEKDKDIAVWGRDANGVYLSVNPVRLRAQIAVGEEYKDIFLGEGNYKPNTQYVFSIEWKTATTEATDKNGLYLRASYTDGTKDYILIASNQQTSETRTDYVTAKGKTIQKISSTYGYAINCIIYSLGLFEGNKPLPEISVATEDLTGQSNVNLVDGGKEVTVNAGTNNTYFKALVIPKLKPNTVYHLSFKAENLVGTPTEYKAEIRNANVNVEYAGLLSVSGGILITTNNFTDGEGRLCLFAGKYGSTAGNSVKFSEVMLVEGFTAPSSYSPSPGDVAKDIKDVSEAVTNLNTTITGAFKDGIIDEAEAKAIASNINILNAEKADIDAYYTKLYANAYLTGTAKTNLASAKTAYNTAHANLISSINTAIADGKATAAEKADVNAKFTAYNNALSAYKTRVGEADKAIQDRIKELAEQDATNKVDGIQIGVRNLFLDSGKEVTNNSYNIKNYYTSIDLITGGKYTLVLRGTTTGGQKFGAWFNDGNGMAGYLPVDMSGEVAFIHITAPTVQEIYKRKINIYNFPSSGSSANPATIKWACLYEGHIKPPMDWVQAPEDMEQAIQGVQDDIDAANAMLADIANDNKLTPSEKQETKKEWDIIVSEKATIVAQAATYSVSSAAYTNAYNALNTYITPLLANLTVTSDIVGTTFRSKFKAYYDAKINLLKAVTDAAKQFTQDEVSNIQVGGTNLFPISKLNPVSYRTSSSKEGSGPEIVFKCNTPSAWAILPVSIPIPLVPANTNFIISMDIRNTNGFGFEVTATSSTPTIPGMGLVKFENTTNEWKRIVRKLNSGNNTNIGGINLWGVGDVRHIKIEIGNKATDWSPAPEDVDQAIQDAIAKTVDVSAPSQVFKYGPGYAGTPTPASILLTASPRNFTPTSYQWQYLNGSTWTNISGATGSTYSVAPGNTTFFPSGTNVRTFRCICNGDEKLSDSFTIAKLADGATGATGAAGKDAYTVLLGNESHAFAGSTAAALAGSTTCGVTAYKGATQVVATIGTITGLPAGMTASVASNGTTAPVITFTVTTSMKTASGTVKIPVTVDGKVFTKVFSYSIAFKGATGATGSKGDKGDKGDTGTAGKGVKSVTEQYYLSTSSTTQTGGSWSSTMPAWTTGKYLWTRLITTYTDDSTTTSNPILDPLNEAVDKAETLSKDDIAKQLGFTDFEALKNKSGYFDTALINTNALITDTAFINSLSAKILTTNVIKAGMISIPGFTFKENEIIGGSDFGAGAGGIKITSTDTERSFKAYKDASHYVEMFYRSASDWGLKGVVGGSELLKLGTKSMISGWEMSTTGFQSSDFVQPTWSGSAISGGKGSKLFPDGGIMLMPSGTGILPLSSGVMQAGLIKVEGDNSMLVGLEIVARGNGYLKDIVALKLSAVNDYSSPSKYPTALEITSGDFNIYSGGIYMKAPWNNLSMQNYSYIVGGCGHVPTSIRQTGSTNCYLEADQNVVLVNNSQHFNVFLPDARNLKPGHTVKFIPLQSSYSHGIIADSGNYGAKIRYKNSLYDWVYVNSVSGGRTAIIECTYIGIFGGYRNWVAGVLNQDGISYGSN